MLACGANNSSLDNKCWRYQASSDKWVETSPLTKERHFGSMVSVSGSLIVMGGRDGGSQPMALGDMEQLDMTRGDTWHQVSTKLSVERSYQCSLPLARDKILVTGGYSWNSIIGKTEALNLTSKDQNNWETLEDLNTPR